MGTIVPDEIKTITSEKWAEWAVLFTNGNRGRLISIFLEDDNPEGDLLVEDVELVALDYDPIGKGDTFIISHGDDENPTRHEIEEPISLVQGQDANGLVVSLSIEDASGTITMIKLN